METEVVQFTKQEELTGWADENDILLNLTEEEVYIILGYMEGHGYAIGCDSTGRMYQKDTAEEAGEWEEYSIDDVIDKVCEWNYELILEADEQRNSPDNFIDFANEQARYEKYKADEMKLDLLFERTSHGKQIEALAQQLVGTVMAGLEHCIEPDKVAAVVAEGIKACQADKRGGR